MAEAAISSLVQVLGDVLIQKVQFLQGVEGKVRLLKDELESMQAFLIDANKKQYEDAGVRNWISQVRELAQDAQDTIEMFVINVENARNDGLLQRCISFPKCVSDLDTIGEEIDSIFEKLEAIKRRRDTYEIKDHGEAAASTQSSNVEWRRRQIDENPVGLEGDVEELLRGSILNEERRGLSIAVVEGMGGIGKSTLARKIYNHPHVVGDGFECRAWIVFSSEFSPQETIKQLIIELLSSDKQKLRELEESSKDKQHLQQKALQELRELEESMIDKQYLHQKLQEMLRKQLEGKTYFIVLDDVWEVEHWELLHSAFPNQPDKTSRLLITTRNNDIAKCGQYAHKMKVLNTEKSWELLLNKVFDGGNCPQELESTGRQILEKCNGLPLAIRAVGGLLMGKRSKSEWEQVMYQINSHLGRESYVSAILDISYQNLSPQLKSCFLCLAFFKEDTAIFAERLVNIWIGLGLIQQEGRRTMEEIGRGYLDELINVNMVQINKLDIDEGVKTCQLHDLVREVCLKKAEEEIGFVMVNPTSASTKSSSKKPRHCVVYDEKMEFFSLEDNKHLRSLFLVNVEASIHVSRYWKSFQLLKILNIEGFDLRTLPLCFRTLIGLKYLRIQIASKEVMKIPRWLDHLKKLEVIDFGNGDVQFPNVKLKMERLRYFRAGFIQGVIGLENWKNIETLRNIWVDEWMRNNSKLMDTCPVRELGIRLFRVEDSIVNICMFRELLEKMDNLVKLHLLLPIKTPVDATLYIPHLGSRLTKLKLRGVMTKFPSASQFPPNLSHLTLKYNMLNEDPMQELGKLPNLSYLKLNYDSYNGERMNVLHDGFPCLKVLVLAHMFELRGIDIEEGGMSHLKHLRIQSCSKLETQNLPKHIIISAI